MMFQNKDYFHDIEEVLMTSASAVSGLTPATGGGGDQVIQFGSGRKSLNADPSGFWIGGARFNQAPFRIDIEGNAVVRIRDFEDNVVLDEFGVSSLQSFPFIEKTKLDDQTVTDAVWQDVLGLNHEITVPRPSHALFFATICGYPDSGVDRAEFRFKLNNAQVGSIFTITHTAEETVTGACVGLLQDGVNNLIIQARSSGTGDSFIKGTILPCYSYSLLLGR